VKRQLVAAILALSLGACSTTQQFDFVQPAGEAVLGVGGVTVITPYTKLVYSGNAEAIAPGTAGSGAEGGNAE